MSLEQYPLFRKTLNYLTFDAFTSNGSGLLVVIIPLLSLWVAYQYPSFSLG